MIINSFDKMLHIAEVGDGLILHIKKKNKTYIFVGEVVNFIEGTVIMKIGGKKPIYLLGMWININKRKLKYSRKLIVKNLSFGSNFALYLSKSDDIYSYSEGEI